MRLLVYASLAALIATGTASVGSEHDLVLGITAELGLVGLGRKELDVRATAVNVLLVLGSKLKDEILSLVVDTLSIFAEYP